MNTTWKTVEGYKFQDITYHRHERLGIVRVAFNRPEVRNAFRPETVDELLVALDDARRRTDVGVVLLTGNGPSPRDGVWAFCSGGIKEFGGLRVIDMLMVAQWVGFISWKFSV